MLKNKLILLVEDEQVNQQIALALLQQWNAEIDLAENGQEALNMLQKKAYDLILMDISMPVLDGFSTAKIIRNELGITTPIIAISADEGEVFKQKVLDSGMNDALSKPISMDSLFVKIAIALEMKPAIQKDGNESVNAPDARNYKLCDIEKLRRVLGIDTAQLKIMILKFLEITPNYYLDILNAYEISDFKAISQTAHKLKSSLELLSSMEMISNIRLIKEYAESKENNQKLIPLIHFFRDAYPELCKQLKEELLNLT
ncbi:MAG: response regulator [Bacteroidota bacterium]